MLPGWSKDMHIRQRGPHPVLLRMPCGRGLPCPRTRNSSPRWGFRVVTTPMPALLRCGVVEDIKPSNTLLQEGGRPRWQLRVKQRPERPTSRLHVFILRRRNQASAEQLPDNAKRCFTPHLGEAPGVFLFLIDADPFTRSEGWARQKTWESLGNGLSQTANEQGKTGNPSTRRLCSREGCDAGELGLKFVEPGSLRPVTLNAKRWECNDSQDPACGL